MADKEYVEHSVMHPTALDDAETAKMSAQVRGKLQRKARESGRSLADPEGIPVRVASIHTGIVVTTEGPVDCTTSIFRMATVGMPELGEVTVEAVEQPDGTWEAAVPAAAIVSVRHGLDSYEVYARALDADGEPTGFHAFMPVEPGLVEIVPLPTVARVIIERLPDEPDGAVLVPASPREVGA